MISNQTNNKNIYKYKKTNLLNQKKIKQRIRKKGIINSNTGMIHFLSGNPLASQTIISLSRQYRFSTFNTVIKQETQSTVGSKLTNVVNKELNSKETLIKPLVACPRRFTSWIEKRIMSKIKTIATELSPNSLKS